MIGGELMRTCTSLAPALRIIFTILRLVVARSSGALTNKHPLSLQHLSHGIELHLDAKMANRLFRFDEGTADIVIPNQPEFERNSRPLGIAERGRHPGIR